MGKVTTLCFGRFLVDLPAGVHIKEMGQQSQFMYGEIVSEPFMGGVDGFEKKMAAREIDARAGKNPKNYKFDKIIHTSIPNTRILITRDDDVFGLRLFRLEMYHWVDEILFSMTEGPYDQDHIWPSVEEIESEIVARLRGRASNEIPAEAGFCIKDGFISNDGSSYQSEEARMQINFQEWPDVWASFYSQTVPKAGDESLLTRINKGPETLLEKAYIRTLRRGKHEVNGFKGEESLDLLPTEDGFKQHYFNWEALGAVKNIFAPILTLQFETATLPLHGPRPRPSLTDDQAIKLYDTIVNSIRLRPTTAPVKTGANDPPKKPVGELAVTGRACPQTGWWQCNDVDVATDLRRQHFKEGDVLPMALRRAPTGLWKKVKGDQPVATIWQLVAYGEAPETAKQERKSVEAGVAKDVEPPTDG